MFKKTITCTALHLVLRFCRNGLMVVSWSKHVVIVKINISVFDENQKQFCFSCINPSGHYATSRTVAGSIPDGVIGIFHWHNPSGCSLDLGLTQLLTETSTRYVSWG